MRYGPYQCNEVTIWENPGKPLVVYIHGGAFVGGSRFAKNVAYGESLAWLAQQDYEVASIDYRLVLDSGANNFPAGRDDICVALEYLKTHTDAPSMVVLGTSAGATLGCLASQRRSDIVDGFIGLYIPADLRKSAEFDQNFNDILEERYFDSTRMPKYRHHSTSPAKTIKTEMNCEAILIGGADDTTVLPIQWERFGAQVNIPTHTLPGLGHRFDPIMEPASRNLILDFLAQFR